PYPGDFPRSKRQRLWPGIYDDKNSAASRWRKAAADLLPSARRLVRLELCGNRGDWFCRGAAANARRERTVEKRIGRNGGVKSDDAGRGDHCPELGCGSSACGISAGGTSAWDDPVWEPSADSSFARASRAW